MEGTLSPFSPTPQRACSQSSHDKFHNLVCINYSSFRRASVQLCPAAASFDFEGRLNRVEDIYAGHKTKDRVGEGGGGDNRPPSP